MSAITIKEFAAGFSRDINSDAQALDILLEHAFVEKITEVLCDYGEFENFELCHWQAHGIKIDGFAFDDEFTNLTLVVSHFLDAEDPAESNIPNSEIDRVFNRAMAFFEKSYQGKLKEKIEISNPAQELAVLIHECKKTIASVRVIIVTDGVTRERPAEEGEFEGIAVSKVIWDIERVRRFVSTGQREQVEINFEEMDAPIKCVRMESDCDSYTAYLGLFRAMSWPTYTVNGRYDFGAECKSLSLAEAESKSRDS